MLPRALRPAAPVPARNDADAAVLFHLQIELQERAREAAEKWKSRAVPWAAARDEGLMVALRREKKTREPRAETELAAGELDRLPKPPRPLLGLCFLLRFSYLSRSLGPIMFRMFRSSSEAFTIVD